MLPRLGSEAVTSGLSVVRGVREPADSAPKYKFPLPIRSYTEQATDVICTMLDDSRGRGHRTGELTQDKGGTVEILSGLPTGSMADKCKKQGSQTPDRKSDTPIVPVKPGQ